MMRIKVCGMVHPPNIEEVAGLEPDFMGYIFHRDSRRYVGPDPDPAIFRIPGPGIRKVGVYVDEELKTVCRLASAYALDAVQLHGHESPDYCKTLKEEGLTVIKTVAPEGLAHKEKLADYQDSADLLLLDSSAAGQGGSGRKFNWEMLRKIGFPIPFLLSGGIGPSDAMTVRGFAHPQLFGVDVNSRFEQSPGMKDVSSLRGFIKQLRENR